MQQVQQAPNDSFAGLSDFALPLMLVAVAGFLVRSLFTKAKVSVQSDAGATFEDVPDTVPGNSEAKQELALLVDFLKNPTPFLELGATVPRRLLLYGPGDKLQMAKAIAGESRVPFLEVISNDSPVHEIFADAQEKAKAPCVLFIALDRRREDEDVGGQLQTAEDADETSELLMSQERLNEVLQATHDFQGSGLIFVVASGRQDVVEKVSRSVDLAVKVGHEEQILVARRLLKANRLEKAVEALHFACRGVTGRSYNRNVSVEMLKSVATDEMKTELMNAQDLLKQHWEKYHDLCIDLPWNGIADRSLRVRQSVACDSCSWCGEDGPGGVVWAAGLALATYVSQNGPPGSSSSESGTSAPWKGVKVLELGSGTGVVGIAAAAAGADVLMTDRSRLVPLAETNITLNQDQIKIGSAVCAAFEWAEVEKPPREVSKQTWDVVLGADLVYTSADVPLFTDTLAFLVGPMGAASGATVIYAHCSRSEALDLDLQAALKVHGFTWRELPNNALPPQAAGEASPWSPSIAGDNVIFWELQGSSEGAWGHGQKQGHRLQ
ncbi:unnamed protein product [Polarella glacialis]|uniref:Calmodulin-lysine N-methyltransferase n=1 Tax=Polarella glacialis TaxID=89957 RepID=A0A813HCB3_POLGL|nr:unnamed protein product [Polarella glacialis]